MPNIQDNLLQIITSIRAYEKKYHRPPGSVSLLAMSKGQAIEKMQAAIAAGQHLFGENYVQEAMDKMSILNQAELEWHFTGHIQSNKTRHIAEHFAWAHTVTNTKVAQRLHEQRPAALKPLNICLEVNVSHEASKSGVMDMAELQALAEYCLLLPRLKLRGLMTIPAPRQNFTEQSLAFQQLALMQEHLRRQGLDLDTLSMGMTADLEAAIAEGATLVRVGQGIFGPRLGAVDNSSAGNTRFT